MSIDPKTMLAAAKVAYPEFVWRLMQDGKVCWSETISLHITHFHYFDPINNDSDWVKLREGLDKLGYSVVWRGNWWAINVDRKNLHKYDLCRSIKKITDNDYRYAALKLVEVLHANRSLQGGGG